MDTPLERVVCYLRMNTLIRKNVSLPNDEDLLLFEDILYHIRTHRNEQSDRIEEVLELLSSLRHDLSTPERTRVITRLRNVLSRYQWGVQVSPTLEGFRAVHFPADRGRSSSDRWEYWAVGSLLELVPRLGKRPRIRRCAVCKEWFYAVKPGKHDFCSGVCRQRNYDRSPEMRQKKKLYMRQRRADERELEERRKMLVGFRGPVKRRVKASAGRKNQEQKATTSKTATKERRRKIVA